MFIYPRHLSKGISDGGGDDSLSPEVEIRIHPRPCGVCVAHVLGPFHRVRRHPRLDVGDDDDVFA